MHNTYKKTIRLLHVIKIERNSNTYKRGSVYMNDNNNINFMELSDDELLDRYNNLVNDFCEPYILEIIEEELYNRNLWEEESEELEEPFDDNNYEEEEVEENEYENDRRNEEDDDDFDTWWWFYGPGSDDYEE